MSEDAKDADVSSEENEVPISGILRLAGLVLLLMTFGALAHWSSDAGKIDFGLLTIIWIFWFKQTKIGYWLILGCATTMFILAAISIIDYASAQQLADKFQLGPIWQHSIFLSISRIVGPSLLILLFILSRKIRQAFAK